MQKVLEGRDEAMHDSLISKDKFLVDMMESFNHHMKSMYYEQINMGTTLGSKSIRESELVQSNVKMLDRVMATVSRKKKIVAPKITISNYILYVIKPPYEHAFVGPLVSQEPKDPQEE